MKEVYKTIKEAEKAFKKWTKDEIIYLVFDKKNKIYRIVSPDRLDFLNKKFDLDRPVKNWIVGNFRFIYLKNVSMDKIVDFTVW
jgi:hypothetical protein